jgi:hypothetical protein
MKVRRKMDELWRALIPNGYYYLAVKPVHFEQQEEASVRAKKIIGFDINHHQCFYMHTFTLSEERFDIDEFPMLLDVYQEHVLAWRLLDGKWIKIKSYSDQLDHYDTNFTYLPPEILAEMPR